MKDFFNEIKINKELKKGVLLAGIGLGIFLGFRYLLPLVIPFLIAFILAGILRPVVDGLIRLIHCSEMVASVLVLILVAGAGWLISRCLVNGIWRQTENLVSYLPFYREQFLAGLNICCNYIDTGFHLKSGASLLYATETLAGIFSDFRTTLLPRVTNGTVNILKQAGSAILLLFIMVYSMLCMLKNYPRLLKGGAVGRWLQKIWGRTARLLMLYIKAEGSIALIQAGICSLGLWILGNPYSLLLGAFIAIVDALPVLGSGTVLIPWGILRLLTGDVKMGIGVLLLYLLCTVNRQLLEPRLLGRHLGMSTLLTLFLMYVGYKLFGILGFLLGPVGFILGREIYMALVEIPVENQGEKQESEK